MPTANTAFRSEPEDMNSDATEAQGKATFSPLRVLPFSDSGTTVNAQRTPVKPPLLENERNSMAHSRAPGIS